MKKIFLPSEEKLKSSWKDVSGFVKGLLHTHDSREKRKDIHKKLQGLQVIVNENGEATYLNFLPYFLVINRGHLLNQLSYNVIRILTEAAATMRTSVLLQFDQMQYFNKIGPHNRMTPLACVTVHSLVVITCP